jgi:hypothetical protein
VINSVLALGFDDTKFNWSDLTPIAVEHKKLSNDNENEFTIASVNRFNDDKFCHDDSNALFSVSI